MNWLNTVLILGAAFLAVFWEAAFSGLRRLLGAQIDLLPPLMVYAGLCAGLPTIALLAAWGGLCLDSLSATPLGISIAPLFIVGLAVHSSRELVLRDQPFAQAVLGLAASAGVPLLTLLLLLTTGQKPLLGWGTLWQLAVTSAGGALITPLCFILFDWLHRSLTHGQAAETSFRADREIRRGRG
jgi:cell shape-determining protein MreD